MRTVEANLVDAIASSMLDHCNGQKNSMHQLVIGNLNRLLELVANNLAKRER